ncbi:MAG: tyrosine-type recombinase/integrase, partial [Hyphomicrobiales bacterium]
LQSRNLLDPAGQPIERVDRSRLEQFLQDYRPGRGDYTVATTVRGIADFCRAAQPEADISWLSRRAGRLMAKAKPVGKKLQHIAPIPDLQDLGVRLMTEGKALVECGRASGAQLYRDGLMIALLAARPENSRRNLADLRIGHSLRLENGRYRIVYDGSQTKSYRPIDCNIPAWLEPDLDHYIKVMRPILQGGPCENDEGWLWIGRRGRRLPASQITTRISKTTLKHLHRAVSPQRFRDSAATDIAIHAPENVGIIMPVLGHASHATGEKHYNQATSFEAAQKYHDLLAKLRR